MERNRLICGDALKALPKILTDTVQLVIADPPYFQVAPRAWDRQWVDDDDYIAWSLAWLTEALRVLRPDGLWYCFGQLDKREHAFLQLMSAATHHWQFHNLIIWDRALGYNERSDSFTPATEMILVLRKSAKPKFNKSAVREPYNDAMVKEYLRDSRYKNRAARARHLSAGKFATNLWRVPSLKGNSNEKCGHPTQKPEKLIERIIISSSDAGDLVLDPFLGSGTTAVVAERLDRRWLGIEKSRVYVKMAQKRIRAKRATKKRS